MGSLCSKCFKKTSDSETKKQLEHESIKNNNITKSNMNFMISPGLSKRKDETKMVELIKIEENKDLNYQTNRKKEEIKETKIDESISKKSSFKRKYDDYFDIKEKAYYQRLYETEKYDIIEHKKIVRFQKGELLGEGSCGKVYQGFDGDGGQIIAIKEIDLKKINSKNLDRIKSFEQEIEILSKLNNKNIIKYYGTCRTNEKLNIFLEYCIGGSIAKMLEIYGKFKENLIRKYTKQILEGLEYLHAHNVVHRGGNILVDKDGVCKLSDFGGAKRIAEEMEVYNQSSFKGTPHWMAPETIKSLESSRYCDIWSLGCTIIEMATGEPPWAECKSAISAIYNIMNAVKPPNLPTFLSDELKNFISHCMKMVPNERLNVYKLLRHPFITGDTSFVYETKILSSDIKNFKSESLRKYNHDNEIIIKINSGFIRKSSEEVKNDQLHFSHINPMVLSTDKKFMEKFESNNKVEIDKKISNDNITRNKSGSKQPSIKSINQS